MTKFLPKILLKKVELTRDKDSNDDKIPPKDLVEEGWDDQWQRLQWWQNSSQRSCWRSMSIIQNVERPVTKPAMMTSFLPKILLKKVELTSDKSSWRWLELVPKRSDVCSLPPSWQRQLKMIGPGPKTFWCLLSSTNLLLLISTSPSHISLGVCVCVGGDFLAKLD